MLDAPLFSQPSFPNSPRSPPFFLDRWTSDFLPGPELPENIDNNCSLQLQHEFGHDLHPLRSVHHDRGAPHEDFPDLDPNDQSVNLNISLGSDQKENLGSKTQAVDAQSQNQPVVAAMPSADSKKGINKKGGTTRGTKRFVGVRQRPSGRWVAEIKDSTQKIRLWLGTFDSAEAAARAYDDAARALRGANTRTNFAPPPNASSEAAGSASKASYMLLQRVAGKSSSNSASSVHSESEPMMLRDSLPFQAQQHEKAPTIPGKNVNVDTSLGSDSSYYFKVEGIYEALREKLSKTLNKFPPLPFQRNGSGRFSSNGSGDTSDIITKAVADVYGRASNPIAGVLARTRSLSGPSTYNADKTSAALSFTRSNIKPSFVVPSVSTDSYFVPQMHGVDINSAVDQKTTSLDSRERSHGTSSIENPMQDLSLTSIFTEGDHMRSANAPSSMMSGLAPSTTSAYISNFLPEFCNPHSSFELNQQAISSYNASSFNDGQCLPRSMSASSRLMTTPCSLPPAYKKCKLSPSRNIPPSFNASMYAPEEHSFLNDWSSELKPKAANRDTSPSGASPEQQPVSCSSFSEEAINEAHSEESLLEGSSDPSSQEIPWSFWDEVQICETTA